MRRKIMEIRESHTIHHGQNEEIDQSKSMIMTDALSRDKSHKIDKKDIPNQSEFIKSLADKLIKGQSLTENERKQLSSIRGKNSLKKTIQLWSNSKSRKIEIINAQIKKSTSNFNVNSEKTQAILDDDDLSSKKSQKSAAALLLSYDDRLKYSHFHSETTKIIESGNIVSEKKLHQILQHHNKVSPKQPQNAGNLVFEVGKTRIFYDKEGSLAVGLSRKNKTNPIELHSTNVNISQEKIDACIEVYRKIANNRPYNNAAPMLEFMSFFREIKKSNPNITLQDAFEAFHPSSKDMFDKYQSGDCVIISDKLKFEMAGQGIQVAVIGQYTGASWARSPIPGSNDLWREYDKRTENIHHAAVVMRYTDENGQEKGYLFDSGNEIPDEFRKSDTWKQFSNDNFGKNDTALNIVDVGHVSKAQLSGKTKLVIKGSDNQKQILGIDLLAGNLYLSSDGTKGLQGLPTNDQGRVSINLNDLKNPNAIGTYNIDGKPVKMSHLAALKLVSEITKTRFQLPDDFVDNILTLADVSEDLFANVLLPPADTLKQVYPRVQEATKQVWDVEDKFKEVNKMPKQGMSKSRQDSLKDLEDKQTEIRQKKIELENAINSKNANEAKKLTKEIGVIHGDAITIFKRLTGDATLNE